MRFLLLVAALSLSACGDAEAPVPDPEPAPPVVQDDGRQSVSDVVSANPRLRTTARLLAASGLDATLRDTSTTYTLFAPSDDAWATLGDAGIAALEADTDALRATLLGHVLSTRMLSFDVFPDLSIETVAGTDVTFAEDGDELAVRSASGGGRITDADLDADNGVVHIIDGVLAQ